jgi:hypothetical protein
MSQISITGAATGTATFTLESPATSTNRTLTLPDNTGTIITQNSTPAFASTIGVGGATAAASGAGITFPATVSASSDANTLDDYEEGSWTPNDASGANLTFLIVKGRYTKIGREVTCYMAIQYPSTVNGAVSEIGGLPFTSGNPYGSGSDAGFGGYITFTDYNALYSVFTVANSTNSQVYAFAGTRITNATLSDKYIYSVIKYFV